MGNEYSADIVKIGLVIVLIAVVIAYYYDYKKDK